MMLQCADNKMKQSKSQMVGAADAFLDQRLALGRVAFPLADLVKATGLSVTATRNQLLRLKKRVTRVSPRHRFFLIVSPEHSAVGAPPVAWWLHDYFQWLGERIIWRFSHRQCCYPRLQHQSFKHQFFVLPRAGEQ